VFVRISRFWRQTSFPVESLPLRLPRPSAASGIDPGRSGVVPTLSDVVCAVCMVVAPPGGVVGVIDGELSCLCGLDVVYCDCTGCYCWLWTGVAVTGASGTGWTASGDCTGIAAAEEGAFHKKHKFGKFEFLQIYFFIFIMIIFILGLRGWG